MTALLNGIDLVALRRIADGVRVDPAQGKAHCRAKTCWEGQTYSMATASEMSLAGQVRRRHLELIDDEAPQPLGLGSGPTPQAQLLAALSSCLALCLITRAAEHGIAIDRLEVRCEGGVDLRSLCEPGSPVPAGFEAVHCRVTLRSSAPRERIEALHEQVLRMSPAAATLARGVRLVPSLVVEPSGPAQDHE